MGNGADVDGTCKIDTFLSTQLANTLCDLSQKIVLNSLQQFFSSVK